MDREEAIELLTEEVRCRRIHSEGAEEITEAIETLLAPPAWHTLQQRPLTKEDVGKWAWVVFEHSEGFSASACIIDTWPADGVYFASHPDETGRRDRIEQYSIIGFPPPAPKKEGE